MITGASSGIGAAMAHRLAQWGCDLLLTARRGERLEALAGDLRTAHGVQADWIALDLTQPQSAEALYRAAYANHADVDILINNAGFGEYQTFHATSWQRNAAMIQLNVVALAELTHRFLQVMAPRSQRSYILNTSSIIAFMPMPFFVNYGATKAYVQVFTESLAAELKGTNVSVTSLCSGGTNTEFSQAAGQKLDGVVAAGLMDPDRVAAIGLLAMLRRKRHVVPGVTNRILCFCTRFLPRGTAGALAPVLLGKPAAPGPSRAD